MPDIVGIRFKKAGKIYYFDPANIALKENDQVVVQTTKGVELGEVLISPRQVPESEITGELKPIVRLATEEDLKRAQDYAAKESAAMEDCTKLVAKLKLPMKLVSAEYNLDGSRLTFYFTAEDRVDFRELVKELTSFFKTRIELRQIGPRDQAKMVGGLGRCGRLLCCATFLSEFNPVSIKMAKEQDLPLDPLKISGVCGRLQCCLAYENQQYREAKQSMPRRGERVNTPNGQGMVVNVNPLKETVSVELESGGAEAEFTLSQIQVLKDKAPSAANIKNEEIEIEQGQDKPKSNSPQEEQKEDEKKKMDKTAKQDNDKEKAGDSIISPELQTTEIAAAPVSPELPAHEEPQELPAPPEVKEIKAPYKKEQPETPEVIITPPPEDTQKPE